MPSSKRVTVEDVREALARARARVAPAYEHAIPLAPQDAAAAVVDLVDAIEGLIEGLDLHTVPGKPQIPR
jgi:hypothetical protein